MVKEGAEVMPTELHLQRKGNALVPMDQGWSDLLCELPEDIDLRCKITRARSVKQLGTYWGVMRWLIDYGPEWIGKRWITPDILSDALQIRVGFTREIASPLIRDQVFVVPRSKSFQECSQQDFNTFFEAVQTELVEWCEYNPVEMYLNWMADRARGAA